MRVMIPKALSVTVEIDVTDCPTCGAVFGVASDLLERRRKDGEWFYCPAGHQMRYTETEAAKLRKQLEAERERSRDLEAARLAAEDQARAAERERKRSRRELSAALQRIHNGVCPHCNRTFKAASMLRHFETQHPDLIAAARTVDRG